MTTVKTYKGHDVPEGATHYTSIEGYDYFLKDGYFWTDSNAHWVVDETPNLNVKKIKLPPAPEAYMPKVGGICEGLRSRINRYMECEVLAQKNGMYAVSFKDMEELQWCSDFRPIKTDREKVIEWFENEWLGYQGSMGSFGPHLYDLGALTIPEDEK